MLYTLSLYIVLLVLKLEKSVRENSVRNNCKKRKQYKDQRTFKRVKYRSNPKIKTQVFLGTKKYFFIKKQGIPVSQRNKCNKIHLKTLSQN